MPVYLFSFHREYKEYKGRIPVVSGWSFLKINKWNIPAKCEDAYFFTQMASPICKTFDNWYWYTNSVRYYEKWPEMNLSLRYQIVDLPCVIGTCRPYLIKMIFIYCGRGRFSIFQVLIVYRFSLLCLPLQYSINPKKNL